MDAPDETAESRWRGLPSVEKLIASRELAGWDRHLAHPVRVRLARELVSELRREVTEGGAAPPPAECAARLSARYEALIRGGMRKVINATGVVLHTNLGRAPIGAALLEEVARELDGYASLEWDETRGERGTRSGQAERAFCLLTGAEAALLVNNNAAAVLLALHAIARGRAVVLSRGELVQIGGGFRMPEIFEASGARLVEVGTTNITSVRDFRRALDQDREIACVLKVHQSNFAIVGHTEAVAPRDLAALARSAGVPLVVDLGSGALRDEGVDEWTVSQWLEAGASLVTVSGDKLLGGPQAGILAGEKALIARLKASPLARALRLGKFEMFVLERTLAKHLAGERPLALELLHAPLEAIRARAEGCAAGLRPEIPEARLVAGTSTIGGGTAPLVSLPTVLIELPPSDASEHFVRRLAGHRPAVAVRRENKTLRLDLRTVLPYEDALLVSLVKRAWGRD